MNGYVLVGGASVRFGAADKARALFDGRPLIVHARDALPTCAERVAAVSAAGRGYEDLGFEMVWDVHQACGPLAGIHAALLDADRRARRPSTDTDNGGRASRPSNGGRASRPSIDPGADNGGGASRPSWIAVIAGDLIGASPAWWDLLLAEREHGPAVAFRDDRWHPLFALYSTDLLDEIAMRIEAGRLAPRHLLDDLGVAVAPPPDFGRMKSMNTLADLEELRRG